MEGIRRLLLGVGAAALAVLFAVAGCGGGGSGSGGSPASLVPGTAPAYLEVSLAPDSKESGEIDSLARETLGIASVGEFLSTTLEQIPIGSGEKLDYEAEVEPWVGQTAGLYLAHEEGGAFRGLGLVLETTKAGEAEEFIEKRVAGKKSGEFKGDRYYVEADGETTLGVVGDYVVFGETKANFEEMVEVSEGKESLADSSKFTAAMEAAPSQGVGRAYIDFGRLIGQAEGQGSPAAEVAVDLFGGEARDATAVMTAIPHSGQIELDISTNASGPATLGGDASALLESLPATAAAAFSSAEFGGRFGEIVDQLDENGIPGQVKPGEIKLALGAVGINIDAIAESIGNVGGFLEGSSGSSLGGALLIETNSASEATKTIANLGRLLRLTGTPGVTAISGELSGFSVHSSRLGPTPLIVGASGEKIVVAYGPKAAAQALRKQAKTLGTTADFEAAKKALGSTPISGFLSGGPAVKLIAALLTPGERRELTVAKPFLRKVSYIGAGSEATDSGTVVRLIVGVR
jgi:Protein of unknown function (DUF3352)